MTVSMKPSCGAVYEIALMSVAVKVTEELIIDRRHFDMS